MTQNPLDGLPSSSISRWINGVSDASSSARHVGRCDILHQQGAAAGAPPQLRDRQVHDHPIQPGGEGRVAPEAIHVPMDPEERLLSDIGSILVVANEAIGDIERVRLVFAEQELKGVSIAAQKPLDEARVRVRRLDLLQRYPPERQRRRSASSRPFPSRPLDAERPVHVTTEFGGRKPNEPRRIDRYGRHRVLPN